MATGPVVVPGSIDRYPALPINERSVDGMAYRVLAEQAVPRVGSNGCAPARMGLVGTHPGPSGSACPAVDGATVVAGRERRPP